jgi:tyrosine-protein kinase
MRLSDLLAALRRFWALALAIFLVVVLAGIGGAFLPQKQYRTSATLVVTPKDVNFATISAINFLLPSVVEQVKTPGFGRRVDARVAPWVAATSPSLDASFEPGTAILHVTAQSHSPVAAAAAANAAAREAIRRPLSRTMKMQLLAPAVTPSSPASPRKVPILAGSVVLGAILALLSVAGVNAARRRVQSSEEIQETFGVDVLAELPAQRRLPQHAATLFSDTRYTSMDEAFQRLRTNVEFAAEGTLVVAVTSSAPGEGKSTVAAGLAWAFATVGREVVAVDADLRRPTLHRWFGGTLHGGFADLDDAGGSVDEFTQETQLPNLKLLSAGRLDLHSAQVVHRVLPRILDELEGRVVVIDTPPVLGVSDASVIADLAGNVVLVVDARRRDPSELRRVLRELARAETRVLGAIVNRAHVRHHRYTQAYAAAPPAAPRRVRS